ncbi:MAG: DUF624 domain-containing protein [Oscillospiraceae bacterium]|jgi:uncharacterized membrane protein YesL|nr:DUF624 domain-containing protein [Oscillospiraceae bacterium]
MPLFGPNYESAGAGVSKHEKKKKPLAFYFEILGRKFWKILFTNALLVLFCIPIVTIGPAITAATQVMRKFITEQPIFLWDEFFTTFKKEFKRTFLVGIADLVIAFLFIRGLGFYNSLLRGQESTGETILLILMSAALFFVCMAHLYIYPMLASTELRIGAIIKNSLLLSIVGIWQNIISLAVIAGFAWLIWYTYPFCFFAFPLIPFGWMLYTSVFNSYPIVQKFIINPYYEAKGETNPELRNLPYEEETVFADMGGSEAPITGKVKLKKKGKIVK